MTYNDVLQFCQMLSRRLIVQIICFCLSMLIIWQLYLGGSLWLSLNKPMNIAKDMSPVAISSLSSQTKTHIGLTQPFFGQYIPRAIDDAGVKESMLNVKIVGVLFAVPETASEVILKIEGRAEETFRVGDSIPGEAVIKRITAQGVLLERKGVLESLTLPKNELIFETQAKPLL